MSAESELQEIEASLGTIGPIGFKLPRRLSSTNSKQVKGKLFVMFAIIADSALLADVFYRKRYNVYSGGHCRLFGCCLLIAFRHL